jgi:hypothetical protein
MATDAVDKSMKNFLIDCLAQLLASTSEPIEEFISSPVAFNNIFFAKLILSLGGNSRKYDPVVNRTIPAYDPRVMQNIIFLGSDYDQIKKIPEDVQNIIDLFDDNNSNNKFSRATIDAISQSRDAVASLVQVNPGIPVLWALKPDVEIFDYFIRHVLDLMSEEELTNIMKTMYSKETFNKSLIKRNF